MKTLTVAIAGLGSRGLDAYAAYALAAPEELRVAAVADIRPERVALAAERLGLAPEQCFDSAEAMFAREKLADAAFICTMDRQHVAHARAALLRGYDLLLEKPVSPEPAQYRELNALADRLGRKVLVCHVLRYSPFFRALKALLDAGEIGDIVSAQGIERVCYWHQAHSFVRGNWRNDAETSPMILQKSCHDMDMLLWLTGKRCRAVSSFGGLRHFTPENAPAGAAARCLDCPLADSCAYSAPRFYLGEIARGNTDWPVNVVCSVPTPENVLAALREGPYGRCVYHCDNNVVDHQIVNLLLDDGVTASFTMCAFTAEGGRELRLMGTRGEILGDMAARRITVMPFGGEARVVTLSEDMEDGKGHGGGDEGLLRDFIALLRGEIADPARLSTLENTLESHDVCLAAERSRLCGGACVALPDACA